MNNWKKNTFPRAGRIAAAGSLLASLALPAHAQTAGGVQGPAAFPVKPEAGRTVKAVDTTVLKRFAAWLEQYNAAETSRKASLETEGLQLAKERLPVLGALIVQNPEEAMKYAVMPAQRQKLPKSIVAELEQFVEGDAFYELSVMAALVDMPVPNKPGETQKVVRETLTVIFKVGEQGYRPHFYGKRGALVSMRNVPFYGIAVGQDLVVHESPLRLLEKGEPVPLYAYPSKSLTACPICKKDASKGLIAVSGTTVYYFDELAHVNEFREKLWQADNKSVTVE